jgi:hypothetical protein
VIVRHDDSYSFGPPRGCAELSAAPPDDRRHPPWSGPTETAPAACVSSRLKLERSSDCLRLNHWRAPPPATLIPGARAEAEPSGGTLSVPRCALGLRRACSESFAVRIQTYAGSATPTSSRSPSATASRRNDAELPVSRSRCRCRPRRRRRRCRRRGRHVGSRRARCTMHFRLRQTRGRRCRGHLP